MLPLLMCNYKSSTIRDTFRIVVYIHVCCWKIVVYVGRVLSMGILVISSVTEHVYIFVCIIWGTPKKEV